MKTDRYTKVVLTFIAVGLFLNIAINLPVQPAFAQNSFPTSFTVYHKGYINSAIELGNISAGAMSMPFKIDNQ